MGGWSNIGNAFYELGIYYALKESTEDLDIVRSPYLTHNKFDVNDFRLASLTSGDILVIPGPVFSENIFDQYASLADGATEKGVKLAFLSSGGNQYDKKEYQKSKEFLQKYNPYILVTRDSQTYDNYAEFAKYAYDGVDFAFFSSDFAPGVEIANYSPFITMVFDKMPEPDIHLNGYLSENPDTYHNVKLIQKNKYKQFPRPVQQILDHFRSLPEEIDGYKIIRTSSQINRRFELIRKKVPNCFSDTNPFGYLNLFKNSQLVIGTRIHACVPALSYGVPAQITWETERSNLFDRVECSEIRNQPCKVNMSLLEREKEEMKSFLKNKLS